LIIYDACYTNAAGNGLCPNVSTLASINQVVSDGVVDVVNYSISGGDLPWLQANSLAFLAASNAGVFISTSAGNSGPGASTVAHLEPWVSTVAASTHSRVFGSLFSITGPTPVPEAAQNLVARVGGVPYGAATSGPIIVSPGFADGASDGCTAYPAGTFLRATVPGIAVLRLGAVSNCASGGRRTAALNAGAIAVLFVTDTTTNLGANGTTWQVTTLDWAPIATFLATAGNAATATASFGVVGSFNVGVADAMASFSSRGPNPFALLKPDVSAPGLNIMAAFSRWTRTPAPGSLNVALNAAIGLSSGTSMSSPHNAGAAALVKAVNRSWTPAQIKSALITTAKLPMTKEDTVTDSDPYDRGAGRIDLTRAARAGFLLDETGANYLAADPATGGDPSRLNIPSFQNLNCVGVCTFVRTLRGTTATPVTWTITTSGLPAGAVTTTPASIVTSSTTATTFTLNVDSSLLSRTAVSFGQLDFAPSVGTVPSARMAMAIRAGLPDIEISPAALSAAVVSGATTTSPLLIRNVGNATLNWSVDTGLGTVLGLEQPYNLTNGFSTNFYSGQTPTPGGFYVAEDFVPADTGALNSIEVNGFMAGTPSTALNLLATAITFKIYSASAGSPAGNPEAGAAGEIYSCVRTPTGVNSAGLTFLAADGARFALNAVTAAAAGCPAPPTLTAGTTYWFNIYPTVPGNSTARRWVWGRSPIANFSPPRAISPRGIAQGSTTWTEVVTNPVTLVSFALRVQTDVQCGAPWLSLAPSSASLGLAESTPAVATFNAASLVQGSYRAFLCISSNGTDPDEPKSVVPVNLVVTANAAPTITPTSGLSRQQGSPLANSTVATVTDDVSSGAVTVTGASTVNGITLSNIGNSKGLISGDLIASCGATAAAFTLVASDGSLSANGILNVSAPANTAPSQGTYTNTTLSAGGGATVTPTAAPADNGSIGSLTVAAPGFAGALSVNPTTGVVTIGGAGPAAVYTVTVTATDNCSATSTSTFQLTVNPQSGSDPTITPVAASRAQGSPMIRSVIANVSDSAGAGNVAVTVNGAASATVNGVLLQAIQNNNGVISAAIRGGCNSPVSPPAVSFTLTASSSSGTNNATLPITITAGSNPTWCQWWSR